MSDEQLQLQLSVFVSREEWHSSCSKGRHTKVVSRG
jgi:hypothetical protein